MRWTNYLYGYSLIAIFAIVYLFLVMPVENAYFNGIIKFRKEKDYFVQNSEDSPLDSDTASPRFGLKYFPVETAYQLESGAAFFDAKDTLQLALLGSKTNEEETFIRYGKLFFSFEEQVFDLTFYKHIEEINNDHFFLPFTDKSNHFSTYQSGRYLDIYIDSAKVIQSIDFNLAYNPYCAYNRNYRCPIPPEENYLPFSVEAGEMRFGKP